MSQKETSLIHESGLFSESPYYPRYRFFPDSYNFAQWIDQTQEGKEIYQSNLGLDIGWLNYRNGMNFSGAEWLASKFTQDSTTYLLAIDSAHFNPTKNRANDILGDPYWAAKKPNISPISICADCSDHVLNRNLYNSVDQVLLNSPDLINQLALMKTALVLTKPNTGICTMILSPTNVYNRLLNHGEKPEETISKVLTMSSSFSLYKFVLQFNDIQIDRRSLLLAKSQAISATDYLQMDFPQSCYICLEEEQKYSKIGVYVIQARKIRI